MFHRIRFHISPVTLFVQRKVCIFKIELTSTYEANLFTKIINHIYAVAHFNLVHKHDANIYRVATL